MTRFQNRVTYLALVSALITVAIAIRYVDPFFVRALRLVAFDYYQQIEPPSYDPSLPIRVVDLDAESLAKVGQWPWPRTVVARLLETLSDEGAAAVVFDVLFAEPDQTSLEQVIKRLPEADAQRLSSVIAAGLTNDEVLRIALEKTPSVLPVALGDGALTSIPAKAGFASAGDNPRPFLESFSTASGNLPEFDQAARGLGAYNWVADRDQIVRRVALMYRLGSTLVPSLAAEALRVAQGATTYVLKSANASGETAFGASTGLNHIRIGSVDVPTDSAGGVYFRFRHFDRSAYVPAWKVLAGQVPRDAIDGRIILVGTSASGLLDLRATPVDPAVPGVDIQEQVIEHLLTGEFLTRPDYALALEEFVILVFGGMLAAALPLVSAKYAGAIGGLTIIFVVGAGWAAYRYADLLLDPAYPALVLGIIAASVAFFTYQSSEAQRGQIRSAFSRYLAPTVVQEIVANPGKLKLGGEIRELTLLFCDVRNFSSIAERLSASELTHFINELLTPLSEVILSQRGTIDKYMGDAIMAFWNAPLDDPAHRSHGCAAAVQMVKKVEELNERWQQQALESGRRFQRVRIGIGLNTGECCVGNLGSAMRFDYSAIGDEVNVTSRFEGLTKMYGISVAVGQRALEPNFPAIELDLVQVKGRSRPEKVYTFLEVLQGNEAQLQQLKQLHGDFLTAYRQQRWDDANQLIAACRAVGIAELNTCYSLFASRIGALRMASLTSDWDGSFELTEK